MKSSFEQTLQANTWQVIGDSLQLPSWNRAGVRQRWTEGHVEMALSIPSPAFCRQETGCKREWEKPKSLHVTTGSPRTELRFLPPTQCSFPWHCKSISLPPKPTLGPSLPTGSWARPVSPLLSNGAPCLAGLTVFHTLPSNPSSTPQLIFSETSGLLYSPDYIFQLSRLILRMKTKASKLIFCHSPLSIWFPTCWLQFSPILCLEVFGWTILPAWNSFSPDCWHNWLLLLPQGQLKCLLPWEPSCILPKFTSFIALSIFLVIHLLSF